VVVQAPREPVVEPPAGIQPTLESAVGPVQGYVATRSSTGTKTNTPLIETPESISVVTRDQMDDQGAQSVSQALRYTPGVFTDLRPSTRFDIVPIRGFGGNGGPLQSFVQYQDSLRLQRGISFAVPSVDPYLLERIEVLRGPASILYGQTNLGGLINLVSKRPTATPFREVEVAGGTWDLKQGAFDFSGPIDAEGKWLYRLTGLARDSETQVDYVKDRRYTLSPALTWRPTADTTLTILSNYTYDPASWYSTFLPGVGTVQPNPNGQIPISFNVGDPGYEMFTRDQKAIGYQFEHRFNDVWTVRQNLRYMRLGTDFRGISPQSYQANLHTINRQRSIAQDDVGTLANDNQVQAQFATGPMKHTLLAGVDYQYADASRLLGSATVGTPPIDYLNPVYFQAMSIPPIQTDAHQINDQTGLYVQDQIKIGNLVGIFGVRHDRAGFDFEQITLATKAKLNVSQADAANTWKAGLLYHFDAGVSPYVIYSTSFEPVTGTVLDFDRKPFLPTTGEQYEAGVKYEPPGWNALITVAAYQLTQQNVQTPDPNPAHTGCSAPGTRCSVQTGEIRTHGLEVEARGSVTRNIDVIAAYTYQDMLVTKSTNIDLGKHPVQVPDQMTAFWGMYTIREGAANGLAFGGGVRYVGRSYGDILNTIDVPPFTLVDAAVHYDLENLNPAFKGARLSINASNLFDTTYVASCGVGTQFDTGCYYGLRRTILAKMRYRW
jgi:iron complex outermembrane recepter protein